MTLAESSPGQHRRRRRSLAWGIIGAGDIARKRVARALRDLAPDGALLAVASRTREQAEELAHEHGIPRVHADWRSLVTDRELDAVYVSTPVDLHAEMTVTAARAGKHVLCEKPMALTHAECRSMIRAARRAGVRLGIAYYRRFYPVVVRLRKLLAAGAIGTPVLAEVVVAESFNPEGSNAPRRWLVQRRHSGGGPMMDLGCHRIDLLVHLLGDVGEAHGVLRNLRYRNRDVEDHATAALSFVSGATGQITATHCFDQPEDRLAIFGTEGKLVVSHLGAGRLEAHTPSGISTDELPPHSNLHFPLVEEFNRAVLAGRDPFVSGDEGARASRVLDRIYRRA